MKILKWVAIVLICIIVVFHIIAAFMPSTYNVVRTAEINASFEKVVPLITDLKMWDKWSPWKAGDTAAIYTYNDTTGTNAEMSWEGEIIGSGKLRITSINDTAINYRLTFLDPMESESNGSFIIKIHDKTTTLTWTNNGELSYPFGRLTSLFMDFDKMLGADFERGLGLLNKAVENLKPSYTYEIMEKDVEAQNIAVIRDTISMNETSEVLKNNYAEIMDVMKKQKVEMLGVPMAISYAWDPTSWDFEAAIPVAKAIKPTGRVQYKQSYAGKAVYVSYMGPYSGTAQVYMDLENYIKEKNYEQNGGPWEVYFTDPATEPDSNKWITEIYYPVK